MEETRCIICEADFRPNVMVGDKCIECHDKFPDATCRKDVLKKTPNKAESETMNKKEIRQLIYDVLEEAHIKRTKCKDCGCLFFKKGVGENLCPVCKEDK